MHEIEKRYDKNGIVSYRINIRRGNVDISRTFFTEEDAKLFAFYKERLIDNMKTFEVPLKERVTLRQIIELKINSNIELDTRSIGELNKSCERLENILGHDKFLCQLSYDDWLKAAKLLYDLPVYRGSKAEHNKRSMSLKTLRRILATISSAFSNAQEIGIDIENHPLKVIQLYINPQIRGKKFALIKEDDSED